MRFWHQLLMAFDAQLKIRRSRTEVLAKARFLAQLAEWRERLPRQELQREMDKEIIALAELIVTRTQAASSTEVALGDPSGLRP